MLENPKEAADDFEAEGKPLLPEGGPSFAGKTQKRQLTTLRRRENPSCLREVSLLLEKPKRGGR